MSKKEIKINSRKDIIETVESIENSELVRLSFNEFLKMSLFFNKGNLHKFSNLSESEIEGGETAITTLLEYLNNKVIFIKQHIKKGFSIEVQLLDENYKGGINLKEVDALLFHPAISFLMIDLFNYFSKSQAPDTHTKQPRELLKTISRNLKRDNNNTLDLFTITAEEVEAGGSMVIPHKEEMNKSTGALALYLMELYQIQGNGKIVIENLEPVAKRFNIDNFRLKHYLWNLGGHVWPVVYKNEEGLDISNQLLFNVKFKYSQTVADKYEVINGQITDANRYGNNFLSFLAKEPIKCIEIEPCDLLIKALAGQGLGNILTATEKFLDTVIRLSDMGVKLLTYSTSNKPNKKINEDSLINDLGLSEQLKKQGRPRIRQNILNGLEELKKEGHFLKYSFNDATKIYEWTYGNRITKHTPSKKERKIEAQKEPKVEE